MYKVGDVIDMEETPDVNACVRLSSAPLYSEYQDLWYAEGYRWLETRGAFANTPIPWCWRNAAVIDRTDVAAGKLWQNSNH